METRSTRGPLMMLMKMPMRESILDFPVAYISLLLQHIFCFWPLSQGCIRIFIALHVIILLCLCIHVS